MSIKPYCTGCDACLPLDADDLCSKCAGSLVEVDVVPTVGAWDADPINTAVHAESLRARLADIVDDQFGIQPVMPTAAMIDMIEKRLTSSRMGATEAPFVADPVIDAEYETNLARAVRMTEHRYSKRIKQLELRADRAVALMRGIADPQLSPVLEADLPFLLDAANAATLQRLASVTIEACASTIQALTPLLTGRSCVVNRAADAIAGTSIMLAQLALLCDRDDYRSEYDFHIQMLQERHARATEQEMPF